MSCVANPRRAATLSIALSVSVSATLSACASQPAPNGPAQTADKLTRAIYANDVAATADNFEDAVKGTVTRGDVGFLSDKMHALGEYESLAALSSAPDSGRYTYAANFANGRMVVELRLDPSGKVGAYRVVPGEPGEGVHASV